MCQKKFPSRQMSPHRYHKMSTSSLDTAIQSLPLELREKICKELISAKLKERDLMGWKKVHEELEQIDTDRKCLECGISHVFGISPFCQECDMCTDCGRTLQLDCPDCGNCISEDFQLCWMCYETEEEFDRCLACERCYLCDGCVCPSRQIRPL